LAAAQSLLSEPSLPTDRNRDRDRERERGGRTQGVLLPLDLATVSVTSYGTDGDPMSTRRTKV
jgi:hypothetical protein